MDKDCKMEGLNDTTLPLPVIARIPGEPAIVINGVPPLPKTATKVLKVDTKPSLVPSTGFGDWLVGRELMKSFGGESYLGKIMAFEEETGWYRVVYEDGDSEDLEWSELEELLLPLDIDISLKSLAARVARVRQRGGQLGEEDGAGIEFYEY